MFVKRPIYDQQLKCVAFEILSSADSIANEDTAQSFFNLIRNTDTQLPLFIPFAYKELIGTAEPPLENPVILKLAANDINATYTLDELKNSLFSVALLIDTPQQLAWLNFAEYIALTERLMQQADVTKVVRYTRDKQRKVIAYNLEQPLNFDKCKTMIMDYYCGDFLFKPIENEEEIAANKLNLLQLIQKIQKDNCDLQVISEIIQSDPLLSFQLLKIANSVGFSGGATISSIEQAVARLGLVNLKNWIMLYSMKNISNKPLEILESGLIRAHMAQELAKSGAVGRQAAYTAGLLSILDCLLNKPMAELIGQIALAEEVSSALLNRQGPLGELLSTVIAYEAGNWDQLSQNDLNGIDLSKLYIDSLSLVAKGIKAIKN